MLPLVLLAAAGLLAQTPDAVRARYTKYEHRIPMRDGKRLFTAVYVPKDSGQSYPFLIQRTPYSVAPYGVDRYRAGLGPSEPFAQEGFIFVYQDVRGRYQSEGTFIEMTPHQDRKRTPADVDESSDTWDTLEWLVKHIPNNSGKAGIWGISYPGFYAAAGMIDAHPALVAASPQAPIADLYMGDDAYHNGVLWLAHNFGFYGGFKPHREPTLPDPNAPRFEFNTPDGYEFYLRRLGNLGDSNEKHFRNENVYWDDTVKHPSYDGFWQARNLASHIRNTPPAVMTVGGWFDAEDLAGPLRIFRQTEKNSTTRANTLVMGPWSHGGWARGDGDRLSHVRFHSKTAAWYRENVEFPFFRYHLKDKDDPKLPKALVFETGTNLWRRFDAWPPANAAARTLYFRAGGKLSFEAPPDTEAFDQYLSDPNKPAPFVAYTINRMPGDYMVEDQRHASVHPDVLVYESEVLADDITIAGPVSPDLYVSTTGSDADFVVKLIDVYPDDYPDNDQDPLRMGGYQQLVRGEPFRAKYRRSFEKPEPLTPGQRTRIEFAMPDVCHTFRHGHRIMVQVQSSWFPLADRNPQKFMDIPKARPADFQKATHSVFRQTGAASGVRVGQIQ
ncbi:MAG: CocE/NonD family hydrolase [Acidobacteria bacterium]|nr:CocE/NonD family hydrolase [Acidobacteriota bacterium]MBI3469778.1 CocE/NonD family hydrolase [Candidatus Solibacter usitatus]